MYKQQQAHNVCLNKQKKQRHPTALGLMPLGVPSYQDPRQDGAVVTPRPLAKTMAPLSRMQFHARLSEFMPMLSATACPRVSPVEEK